MKKVLKIVVGLVIVGLIAVVVLVVVVGANLGKIVKAAVETVGPKVTQTSMTLSEVDISAFSGKGELKGLVVGNPKGFRTPHAIKLDRFNLEIDPKSVASDRIVIKDITIEAPEIVYELSLKGSNIGRITENAETFGGPKAPEETGEKPKEEPEQEKSNKPGKKLQINHLLLKDAKITLSSTMPPISASIPLPDIEMHDIGKEGEGAEVSEVIAIILREVFTAATKAVKESGKLGADAMKLLDGVMKDGAAVVGDATEEATKFLGEAGKEFGETGEKAAEAVGGIVEGVGEKAGEALKGFGKLLGGKGE